MGLNSQFPFSGLVTKPSGSRRGRGSAALHLSRRRPFQLDTSERRWQSRQTLFSAIVLTPRAIPPLSLSRTGVLFGGYNVKDQGACTRSGLRSVLTEEMGNSRQIFARLQDERGEVTAPGLAACFRGSSAGSPQWVSLSCSS